MEALPILKASWNPLRKTLENLAGVIEKVALAAEDRSRVAAVEMVAALPDWRALQAIEKSESFVYTLPGGFATACSSREYLDR